jgi:hypothetical protein
MKYGYPLLSLVAVSLFFISFGPDLARCEGFQAIILETASDDFNSTIHSSYPIGEAFSIRVRYYCNPSDLTLSGILEVVVFDRNGGVVRNLTHPNVSVEMEFSDIHLFSWDQKDDNGTQAAAGDYAVVASINGIVGSTRFLIFDPEDPSPIEVMTDREVYQYCDDPIFTMRNLVDWGIPGQNPGPQYHITSENFNAHVPEGWAAYYATIWFEKGSSFNWSFGEMIDPETGAWVYLPPGNYTIFGRMGMFNDTTTFRIVGSPPIPEDPQDSLEEKNDTVTPVVVDPPANVTDPQLPDPPVDGTGSPEEMNETIVEPLDQQPPVMESSDLSADEETIDLPCMDNVEKAPPEDHTDQKIFVPIPPNHKVEDGAPSIFERLGIVLVVTVSLFFITSILLLVLKKK